MYQLFGLLCGLRSLANNPDCLGPAALQRAWTLFNDSKADDRQAVLDTVSGRGSCTHFCLNDLDPLGAIAGLKRETTKFLLKRKG
ncbi:hypothetical protein [Pseudorhodobacter aquimaris]|uniref:hypothetical protein n=1 Tax=Pseudorhodobacter aquimaris TaxID=687412 RepID=UPI000B2BFF50|nr:hypothetical protein [Pseudorhodobacter aquimaris]